MLPHDRRADDLDRNIEVAHQALDHQQLLVVLLAEDGEVRGALQQQLGDHRGDTVEMIGPRGAAQILGQVADLHLGAEALRVHLFGIGGEDEIGAGFAELGEIALLRRADSDLKSSRGPNWIGFTKIETTARSALLLARATKEQMALMQRPHGRHQRDALAGLAPSGDLVPQIADRPHCVEGARHGSS